MMQPGVAFTPFSFETTIIAASSVAGANLEKATFLFFVLLSVALIIALLTIGWNELLRLLQFSRRISNPGGEDASSAAYSYREEHRFQPQPDVGRRSSPPEYKLDIQFDMDRVAPRISAPKQFAAMVGGPALATPPSVGAVPSPIGPRPTEPFSAEGGKDPLHRKTTDIDREMLKTLLERGEVQFSPKLRFSPCGCKVSASSAQVGWCRHRGAGGQTGWVFHCAELTNPSGRGRAVKVYAPHAHAAVYENPDAFERVALQTQRDNNFVLWRSEFYRDGLRIHHTSGNQTTVHTFHIVVMEWIESSVCQLDLFIEQQLSKADYPKRLARVAGALRDSFSQLALQSMAHGDLCAPNIMILPSNHPRGIAAALIDMDTLTWDSHYDLVKRSRGHDGYNSLGRDLDPAGYAEACLAAKNIPLIDAPAAIICYLSALAYATVPNLSGDVDRLLYFSPVHVKSPGHFDARCQPILQHLSPYGAEAVARLVSELRAHLMSPSGIDARLNSPFQDREFCRLLEKLELRVAGQ